MLLGKAVEDGLSAWASSPGGGPGATGFNLAQLWVLLLFVEMNQGIEEFFISLSASR